MKGLEQSPCRKSRTCLKLPSPPSACRVGRRHSVNRWDEGQERGKAGAQTLSMDLPNLCILLQPRTAGVLSVEPRSHGVKRCPQKSVNYLVSEPAPNPNNAVEQQDSITDQKSSTTSLYLLWCKWVTWKCGEPGLSANSFRFF